MQTQGSSTTFCGSSDSIGVPEHDLRVESFNNTAPTIVLPPFSRLHEITLAQEDVSGARKDLLVDRSKTRTAGAAVRSQRIATGNAEGQLLSALREFYNANAGALPPSITEAYDRVIQERDRLGSIEHNYIEAEQTLGGSEWKFMQKEEMLYQYHFPNLRADMESTLSRYDPKIPPRPPPPPDPILLGKQTVLIHNAPPPPPPPDPILLGKQTVLIHNAPPPPPPPPMLPLNSHEPMNVTAPPPTLPIESDPVPQLENRYKSAVIELDNLRKEFDSLRPQQSELLDLELERRLTHGEASENFVRSHELFEQYSALLTKLAHKEVEVKRLRHERWVSPDINADLGRRLSDEWMLDYAKTNPMERNMYMNFLEKEGLLMPHSHSLDEWSERYWFSRATDVSSDGDQDLAHTIGYRLQSTSSTSGDVDETSQTNGTLGGHVRTATQQSQHSSSFLASEELPYQVQSHSTRPEHVAYGTAKSDTARSHSGQPEQGPRLINAHISGYISESLHHRRSKSTSAILEPKHITEFGGGPCRYFPILSRAIMC